MPAKDEFQPTPVADRSDAIMIQTAGKIIGEVIASAIANDKANTEPYIQQIKNGTITDIIATESKRLADKWRSK